MIREEIIYRSMEYILEHLEEDLTVNDIAQQFHFSEYYFNREFKKVTGESVYAFIKRQKLDQSAMEMKVHMDQSITDIGEKYGYSSSNYSSAFKRQKRVSPALFRKNANNSRNTNPFYPEKMEEFETFEVYEKRIHVQELPDQKVYYERYIGSYQNIKEAWYHFLDAHANDIREDTVLMERFYDDPKVVEADNCICDLCIRVSGKEQEDQLTILQGGRFAVYRYEGPISMIYHALQGVFSIWLPNSEYKMSTRYGFNIYRKIDRERDYVVMDLCIPIQ